MHDLLVVRACNSDSGGESDFDRGVHGGYYDICVWDKTVIPQWGNDVLSTPFCKGYISIFLFIFSMCVG